MNQDEGEIASRFVDFLSKQNIISGISIKNAERLLNRKRKQKIVEDTLPKA